MLTAFMVAEIAHAQGIKVAYQEDFNVEQQLQQIKDPAIREAVKGQLKMDSGITFLSNKKGKSLYTRTNDEAFYKDTRKKQLITQEIFLDRPFIVTEDLVPLHWELDNEEKNILNYPCKKATLSENKKNITAWYCPNIPINDGPESYWGLPGLILQIEDGGRTITFQGIDMNSSDVDKTISVPDKGEKMSREKFNELREKKLKDIGGNGSIKVIQF